MTITERREGVADTFGMGSNGADYRFCLSLSVRDREQLWRLAAARALEQHDLDECDVEMMLGPMEDPQLVDCLMMLLVPRPLAGCTFKTVTIEPQSRQSRRSPVSGSAAHRAGDADLNRRFALKN